MKSRPSIPRDAAAFTLLEVCVSMAIFAFIMISVIGCWKCIVSGKMVAEEAAASAQRARIGMKTVEEALTCVEISAAMPNIQFYSFNADTSQKFANLSLAARLPSDFLGSGFFGDLGVMRRVSFYVKPGDDGKDDLMMDQSPLLEALDNQNTPYTIALARDVNIFMLEFWSEQDNDWIVSWDYTNRLPTMVRVTLGCGHSARNPDMPYNLICRTVAIPSVAH